MAKPEAVTQVATVSSETSPKETTEITVATGDVLVACGISEDQAAHVTIEGGGLTWTSRQKFETASNVFVQLSTAVATEAKSFKVKFTRSSGTTQHFWGGAQVWRKSAGVGATAGSTNTEGAPSLSITTTAANSAVAMFSGDWNAKTGAATYRTGAGTFTEKNHIEDGTRFTSYGGYYADAEAAAAKTIGMTAPGSQKYTIAAVEIKGEEGGAKTVEGKATLSGTGTLSAAGFRISLGKATLSGLGSLSAKAQSTRLAQATLSGTGALSASATRILNAKATLSGSGALSAKGVSTRLAQATLSGSGSLSASGTAVRNGQAKLTATGSLTASGQVEHIGPATGLPHVAFGRRYRVHQPPQN